MADNSFMLEATNKAAFDAALDAAARTVEDLGEPLEATAQALVRQAAGNAPRRTGRLASSVHAEGSAKTRVRVVSDLPYAAAIHWGWPGHHIRRQPYLVATWMRDPSIQNTTAEHIQAGLDKAAALAPPR
jgi:hypothetical protein